jgi:hypothetical protein
MMREAIRSAGVLGRTPVSLGVLGVMRMKAAGFDATVLKQIESEVRTIKLEFKDRLPEESIEEVADQSIERLADSRVPQFVPLFVGRFTRERLRELVGAGSASGK